MIVGDVVAYAFVVVVVVGWMVSFVCLFQFIIQSVKERSGENLR